MLRGEVLSYMRNSFPKLVSLGIALCQPFVDQHQPHFVGLMSAILAREIDVRTGEKVGQEAHDRLCGQSVGSLFNKHLWHFSRPMDSFNSRLLDPFDVYTFIYTFIYYTYDIYIYMYIYLEDAYGDAPPPRDSLRHVLTEESVFAFFGILGRRNEAKVGLNQLNIIQKAFKLRFETHLGAILGRGAQTHLTNYRSRCIVSVPSHLKLQFYQPSIITLP